jgi:hypothetical protein
MINKFIIFFELSKKNFILIILLYSITHGGIFFSINSYFWDDLTIVGVNENIIIKIFKENGTFLNIIGYLHVFLLKIGPWIYKLLTFFLFLFTGLFLNKILIKHEVFDDDFRLYFILLFLILPFFLVRTSLVILPYVICNFLFFFAWASYEKNSYISIIMFFFSFIINSYLVLFIIPFLDLYYRKNLTLLSFRSFLSFLFSHIVLVILPFIFFILKLVYFKPYGSFLNYNETYSLYNLIITPLRMGIDFFSTFYPIILVGLILFFLNWAFGMQIFKFRLIKYKFYFFVSILIIFVSCFPYWILGHVPTFSDWSSRHQLLLPFGISLFILVLINNLTIDKAKIIVFIISISIFINLKTYVEFYLDWDKQNQLIQLFKNNVTVKNNNLFLIQDNTPNAINRKYRYYEWSCLFSDAFHEQKRFGINDNDNMLKIVYDNLLVGKPNFRIIDFYFHSQQSKFGQFDVQEIKKPIKIEINFRKIDTRFPSLDYFFPRYELSTLQP